VYYKVAVLSSVLSCVVKNTFRATRVTFCHMLEAWLAAAPRATSGNLVKRFKFIFCISFFSAAAAGQHGNEIKKEIVFFCLPPLNQIARFLARCHVPGTKRFVYPRRRRCKCIIKERLTKEAGLPEGT
jgi:hypothetical protein